MTGYKGGFNLENLEGEEGVWDFFLIKTLEN